MYQTPRSRGTRIYHPTLRTGPCKQPIHKAQNLRINYSNSPILGAGTNELRWVGMVSVSAFSLKVTSGGSILWADSKVICCFLTETTKYCVYLVVFARNTEFCWKNKKFCFLKTGVKTLLKTRKFHKKLTFFVCMLVENRCFHFFEKHEITLLWGIQNSKIL